MARAKKLHLRNPNKAISEFVGFAACHSMHWHHNDSLTDDPNEVTCRNCLRNPICRTSVVHLQVADALWREGKSEALCGLVDLIEATRIRSLVTCRNCRRVIDQRAKDGNE